MLVITAAVVLAVPGITCSSQDTEDATADSAMADSLPEIRATHVDDQLTKLWVGGYVNVILMQCSDKVLLFDAGFEETSSQLALGLRNLAVDRIDYLINTHADRDHTGGNASLGSESTIVAHSRCRDALVEQERFPASGLPTITFTDSLTLHCGADRIRLIALTGGHTNGDIIIHLPHSNTVYLGDIVVPETFPVVWLEYGDGTGVVRLSQILEAIIALFSDDTRFLLAHGRDYTMEDLRRYHDMVVRTIDLVRSAMHDGKTVEDLKREDLLREWSSWNSERFDWINTDFWIDTIHRSLSGTP